MFSTEDLWEVLLQSNTILLTGISAGYLRSGSITPSAVRHPDGAADTAALQGLAAEGDGKASLGFLVLKPSTIACSPYTLLRFIARFGTSEVHEQARGLVLFALLLNEIKVFLLFSWLLRPGPTARAPDREDRRPRLR
ncbi:hypothetical protein GGTG_02001 [Gaeumannomyces tritici R3-111a-1]|uniref:Uncharacterized protein n=1 Tax=Gaeumannomyces tritici (strain R3-111a-1) TaxID=644352 RepID=J3NL60_GAET3|nr:hypothetical protein GGTG_02001 [Gaeumannomyces tritici R3-111a-1]EJT82027.1 hypothetical protein GGTG_02001 [Gaeumannomyces tritici R3-111a-1]